MTRWRRRGLIALLVFLPLLVAWATIRPRNDRVWSPDMAVLPSARFDGNLVHVSDIRNATYRSVDDYTLAWYDRTYDLEQLESV